MINHKKSFILILGTLAFSFFGFSSVLAESSSSDNVSISVPVSCSITKTINTAHSAMVDLGTYEDEIGESTFKVLCNDYEGFAVYAIGYSGNSYGDNTMIPNNINSSFSIASGTATSGNASNWAMKLTAVSGDFAPTLATGFNAYHVVPDEYTKVASLASSTDATNGSSFKSTYAIYVASNQPADTYVGKVKYTVIHPSNASTPVVPSSMQNLSSASCTSTPAKVVDSRDGREYTIQRLLDGNCWMMENLDLGRTDLTTDLTSSNTNLSTTITAATFNSWRKTTGSHSMDTGDFISLDGTDATSGTDYGTLYNYYAASAGTYTSSSNYNDATYDICPAGWKLPSAMDNYYLITSYNDSVASLRASIANGGAAFAFSGLFYSAPTSQGQYGWYWSSSYSDAGIGDPNEGYSMSHMGISTSYAGAFDTAGRDYGMAIRCILKERTMQNVSKWGSELQIGDEVQAVDIRDGKFYTVARLEDGNIWMMQNLDLDLDSNVTYTNLDTDIGYNTSTGQYETASWKPMRSTYTTSQTQWCGGTCPSNLFISFNTPESYDPGDIYWNGSTYSTTDENGLENRTSNSGYSYFHLGNYYNPAAAVATNDLDGLSPANMDGWVEITQSICPSGWMLPKGLGDNYDNPPNGSFFYLASLYGWDENEMEVSDPYIWDGPIKLPLSGSYYGTNRTIGDGGWFIDSLFVGYGNTFSEAYGIELNYYGGVYPADYGPLSYGRSVRCLVR